MTDIAAATGAMMSHNTLIRLEPREAFATIRKCFQETHFDEPTLAARFGERSLVGFKRLVDGRTTLNGPIEDALGALIRLFLDGEPLSTPLVESLISVDALSAMRALSLLSPAEGDPEKIVATVFLYPLRGSWLASDLIPPSEDDPESRQDHVFSANNELTAQFLDAIPATPGARFIELCAGSGVAAVRALANGASSAVASDLIPRCVHFSRFNALLNDLDDRLEAIQSDAWKSVAGEFDMVVAHPPYVPALSHRFDFRDAGGDGEQVTRALIEGAPAHISRGGRMIVRAALSDRNGQTIAQRVREWLGDASNEFDLVQLESMEYGPMDAYRNVTNGGHDFVDCERWLRHFQALGIERFALCTIEFRREAFGRPPVTVRRVLGTPINPALAEWHFQWGRYVELGGTTALERLVGQAPRVAPGVRLSVHLTSDADGSWRNVGALVESHWPSLGVVKAPPLVPTLLELCDGSRDVHALFDGVKSAGLVTEDVGEIELANLLEILAAIGALEFPAVPLPATHDVG